jgi:hypothetical protein
VFLRHARVLGPRRRRWASYMHVLTTASAPATIGGAEAMARELAVHLYWMWRQGWDYGQLEKSETTSFKRSLSLTAPK